MAFDTITGTKSQNLPALPGSIPDTQLVLVPDPVTGELFRSTFGQMKADVVLQIGDLSYLDDIIEVPTVAALPQPGQIKKIYVITTGADANKQFRWGGSIYIQFPQGSGDVAGEAILRGNADAVLQANINAEITNRQNADAALQTNINNEATSRTNADTTINNRLSSEINAARTNESILNGKIDAEGQIRATADNNLQSQIDLKLNASDYNQHYKGKFTSLAALQAALPSAAPGDYAQVDTGAGNDVKNYNWDDEEGWVIGGTVAASTTDALPEGSTNLYFTTERAQAAVDISGKADKTYVDDADQALSDRIDAIQPAPSPTGSRIISGCKESWSGTGLTFDVTPGTFQIQGTPYTFSGDSKTLIPADATLPRFDVLALNISQQLIVITGTPGANPDIPQVDPDSQLYLTAIYVVAGATTPTDIDLSLIYSENAEWVGYANGLTVDFNDTTSPFSGTKDIKVSAGTNGGYLSLTADIAPDITNYSLLKLYIKLNTALNNKSNIVAAFYANNTQVTQFVTLPVNKNITGSYQNISIDLTNFQFSKSLFDTLRITFTGTTFSAFYLDYIQLQGTAGGTQIVNVQNATTTTKGIVKLAGDLAGTADAPTVPALASLQSQITTLDSTKLNAADYNDRFKGKYTTFPALQTAHPTANAGDYAQVDTGAGSNVINYNWDTQDGWVIGSSVGPTLSTTDDLTEGSTNLYFTTARAIAAVDISGKVDKVAGKQLSTEDYTTAEKTKLSGLTNNTGTAGRISITAGVIDIDAAYIGQNTITTLGTIATGTWQGTAIASGYGGTGFSTYAKGDILYASAVNTLAKLTMGTVPDGYVLTAASGLPVWAAASGGSGGGWGLAGNSITSGQFIGTTNAQDLIFKTNNVTQLKLSAAGVLSHSNNLPAVKQYYYDAGAGSRIGVGQLGGNIQFFGLSGGYQFTWNGGGDLNTTVGTNEWMKINGNTGLTVAKDLTVGGNASIAGSFTVATIGAGATTNLVKQYYYNANAANGRYGVGMTNDHPYLQFFIPTNANAAAGWSWNIGGDMQTAGVNEIMRLEQNFGLVITGGISAGSGNRAVASALFDLSSTTKGFLPPRMTLTQWGSIATKAEGLQGWNNSDHGQMWFDGTRSIGFRYNGTKFQGYDGTNWLDLN